MNEKLTVLRVARISY